MWITVDISPTTCYYVLTMTALPGHIGSGETAPRNQERRTRLRRPSTKQILGYGAAALAAAAFITPNGADTDIGGIASPEQAAAGLGNQIARIAEISSPNAKDQLHVRKTIGGALIDMTISGKRVGGALAIDTVSVASLGNSEQGATTNLALKHDTDGWKLNGQPTDSAELTAAVQATGILLEELGGGELQTQTGHQSTIEIRP